eukprot:GHUV01047070.1.p2 GENE.GHUV01047070.1~~GHUV01047070.1.p2  ORF type:complete len:115 (-),score=24.73 GHUV01047070.1:1114-1458(-)
MLVFLLFCSARVAVDAGAPESCHCFQLKITQDAAVDPLLLLLLCVTIRDAMSKCGARLLEPMMKVEVITPEDHMGDVIGDLNSRRGMVNKFDDKPGGMKLVQVGDRSRIICKRG